MVANRKPWKCDFEMTFISKPTDKIQNSTPFQYGTSTVLLIIIVYCAPSPHLHIHITYRMTIIPGSQGLWHKYTNTWNNVALLLSLVAKNYS